MPRNYKHCFFSAVTPGTHITHHNGPTGKKLRIHLPILGTEGARMRVGDELRYLEEGKWLSDVPCFEIENKFIWGATSLMLNELKERIIPFLPPTV